MMSKRKAIVKSNQIAHPLFYQTHEMKEHKKDIYLKGYEYK